MRNEPAVATASVTAAVTAIIALLAAFGLPLSAQQQAAVLGVISVVGPLVVGFVTRRAVIPKTNVVAHINSSGQTVAGPAAPQPNGTQVTITTTPAAGDTSTPPAAPAS